LNKTNKADLIDTTSNTNASRRWNTKAVGGQRSHFPPGSPEYFQQIREYRYGYETLFIPSPLLTCDEGEKVLEIGVVNGIDVVELANNGAEY